jgi:UDP-N-acetylmuramyl tripeptide synthase
MRMRRPVAVGLARTTARLVGAAHHRGTALPGLLAEHIWPEALATLAGQLGTTVVVVGTNGKTTTAGLIGEILRSGGREPVANRSGANMRQGLVTTLVRESDLGGRLRPDIEGPPDAVFEVDEATLEQVLPGLGPSVIVATNLFRDQLDRFGEPDAIVHRWVAALATAADGSSLVYCADDPRLAMLASASQLPTRSFGLVTMPSDREQRSRDIGAIADPVTCQRCGRQLTYAWRSIGHLGAYACPSGHIRRTAPDIAIESVEGESKPQPWGAWATGATVRISGSHGSTVVRPRLPGLPNAYNIAAAVAAGTMIGRSVGSSADLIEGYAGPFARNEWMVIDGRHVVLMLIKNTVSLAETVRLGSSFAPDSVVLGLNDAAADGRDVSWIWDAPIAQLVRGRDVVLTGSRAADLRLRLKYDPEITITPPASLEERDSLADALDLGVSRAPRDGVVVVGATYTALMGLRAITHRRGYASASPR